nr:MAG TPA: hypothetical protein [Caudoviricetes sp.]
MKLRKQSTLNNGHKRRPLGVSSMLFFNQNKESA